MGCISCKTVFLDPTKNKNLAGKARLPGIPKKEKKKMVLARKKILEEIKVVDFDEEKAKILQQLEKENIIVKKASGGVAYVFGDDNQEKKIKPKHIPRRLRVRLERPSTSQGFNSEEKEIMVEFLKNESLLEKGRSARVSEERRFIAEMNREKALKIKARKLEKKLKQREEKRHAAKTRKEQVTVDASIRNSEKQQKAQQRRQEATGEQTINQNDIKEINNGLKKDYRCDNGLPEVN